MVVDSGIIHKCRYSPVESANGIMLRELIRQGNFYFHKCKHRDKNAHNSLKKQREPIHRDREVLVVFSEAVVTYH